ncbi:MAG: hypothetical protein JRE70_07700 [Deltaproteobacteria bacterium]|nr:hypothetical protein [Deltaproteobacteria bacterium]
MSYQQTPLGDRESRFLDQGLNGQAGFGLLCSAVPAPDTGLVAIQTNF